MLVFCHFAVWLVCVQKRLKANSCHLEHKQARGWPLPSTPSQASRSLLPLEPFLLPHLRTSLSGTSSCSCLHGFPRVSLSPCLPLVSLTGRMDCATACSLPHGREALLTQTLPTFSALPLRQAGLSCPPSSAPPPSILLSPSWPLHPFWPRRQWPSSERLFPVTLHHPPRAVFRALMAAVQASLSPGGCQLLNQGLGRPAFSLSPLPSRCHYEYI